MLTADHNGQNYSASELMANTLMGLSWGTTPPKSTMMIMVSMVSLNPQMVYYSCGPLLGCGCPLTLILGSKMEARQI